MTIYERMNQRREQRRHNEYVKSVISRLIIETEHKCINLALARLPENASFELKRQVIRETVE